MYRGERMNHISSFWFWLRKPQKSKLEQLLETLIIVVPIAFCIRTYFYGLYQVPTGSMETTMLVGERFFADKFTVLFREIQHGDIITFNDPSFPYSNNYFMNIFQRYVWGPSNWTKRVIGVPGDHLKGVVEDGKPVVYLNGEKLDEPYINKYPLLARVESDGLHYRSYNPDFAYEDQPFYQTTKQAVFFGKQLLKRCGMEWEKIPGTPAIEQGYNGDIFEVQLKDGEFWVMGDNRLGSHDSRFWSVGGKPLEGKLIHGKILFRIWSMDSTESWWIIDLIKHPIDFWKKIRWNRCLQFVY